MSGLLVRSDPERLELTFEREFAASVDAVWATWTNREDLEAWWGPEGWVTTVRSLDVRPGGLWHFGMGPLGSPPEVWIRSLYSEVITGSVLSYVEGFSDETGADLDPESNAVSVEFFGIEPHRTRLVMRTCFSSAQRLEHVLDLGVVEGWSAGFDHLDHHLEGIRI